MPVPSAVNSANVASSSAVPETTTRRTNPTSMNRPPATVISIDFRAAYCERSSFW